MKLAAGCRERQEHGGQDAEMHLHGSETFPTSYFTEQQGFLWRETERERDYEQETA